jgi:electron transfer flavoprotein alpha subunit
MVASSANAGSRFRDGGCYRPEGCVSVLVFVEHRGNELQKGSLGVLAKAAQLGAGEVAAVLAGEGAKSLAPDLGSFGATKVWACEDEAVAQPLPQARVDVLAQVVADGGYDTVLFANSVLAADVAAGLAARLDAGLNWDLVDVALRDGELVGTRPALQDSVYVEVGWTGTPRLALFRAGSFDATAAGGGEPETVDVSPSYAEHSTAARLVGQDAEESSGPSIEEADVIVAGGRGLGSPENFSLAEELATALGGAVGATRAVVDAGWYPYSAQIGQTGKTVSPKLYVALGISGAIQHKVGMQSSGTIVAINKDANAPIFEFSDLGVVGDVHAIVPKLTELVRERRS